VSRDHPAIIGPSGQAAVTCGARAARISRVAAELAGRGFAPGDVLALPSGEILCRLLVEADRAELAGSGTGQLR
jgi:hypothetical protein